MIHMTSERGECYVLECYDTCEVGGVNDRDSSKFGGGSVRGFWKPPAVRPLRLAKFYQNINTILQFICTIKVIPVSADLAAAFGARFVFFPASKMNKKITVFRLCT